MGLSDLVEEKGWFRLLKRESKSRNCPVVIERRGGNRSPVFRAQNGRFRGKVHCSGRPDRNYDSIWADFPEEAEWLDRYPDTKVMGVWLDINESTPSQRDFSEARDNFVPVTGSELRQHLNSRDALHIRTGPDRSDSYRIEDTSARTNDWDVIFS